MAESFSLKGIDTTAAECRSFSMVDLISVIAANWNLPVQNVKMIDCKLSEDAIRGTFEVRDGDLVHTDKVCINDCLIMEYVSIH